MRTPANDEGMGASDHRVIDHGSWLGVHEVHYDDAGRAKSFAAAAVAVIVDAGEKPEAVRTTLDRVRVALERPVLSVDDFPRGGEM